MAADRRVFLTHLRMYRLCQEMLISCDMHSYVIGDVLCVQTGIMPSQLYSEKSTKMYICLCVPPMYI